MTAQIPVRLHAVDPITRAGVVAALRSRGEIRLNWGDHDGSVGPGAIPGQTSNHVDLVMVESWDTETRRLLRRLSVQGRPRVVLVVGDISDADLLEVVGSGVSAVIRRGEATADAMIRLIRATFVGDGSLPPDLLGRLLNQVSRLQRHVLGPQGWGITGLTDREIAVLRMVADGLETQEIADRLCYSPRTVKSVIHDITSRFQLRNRAHAVAFALREGLI